MMGETKFDFITCYGFKCKAIFLHFFFYIFFFNKCSFWNLLLQIKSGIFPYSWVKGGQ